MRFHAVALTALALFAGAPAGAQRRIPKDLSGVRGFNYQSAGTTSHVEHWLQYSAAETERDFDFAKRLQLNQLRVFIPYTAWAKDKEAFRTNLLHLVRAAHRRGMGVMPTLQYAPGVSMNKERWPESREYVADLIATIGKEPGLAFWDVFNEPECCALPPTAANRVRMEHAVYMTRMFHELDPVTPVTIGATFSDNMIEMGDAQDVLSFHNYLPTRAAIRADIAKAKAYAARTGKPLIDTEIGCIARANPYDVAMEEHMKANVGWYIWELMITHSWGTVHGVFVMSEHFYSYAGQRFDHASGVKPGAFSRANYMVKVDEPLVEWARRPANRVRNKVEAYEEYLERIPALKTRRIPMAIDEWAYTGAGNNLKGALANAMVLQEMFRHSDLIKMAGHTMGTAQIEHNATEAALNTTGLLFKLYRDHFGSVPVEVGGNSPVPPPLYPVGADQPKRNAGSSTYPVDVAAALTADGKSLTLAIINANESARELDLSFQGISLGKGRTWRMTGASLNAATGLGRNEVRIAETSLTETPKSLTIAPISIDIYEFERR